MLLFDEMLSNKYRNRFPQNRTALVWLAVSLTDIGRKTFPIIFGYSTVSLDAHHTVIVVAIIAALNILFVSYNSRSILYIYDTYNPLGCASATSVN